MFPSVISSFNIVSPSDRLNSPSHSALHNSTSSVLTQVQTVIGVEGANSVLGTLMTIIKSPGSEGGGHIQGASYGGTGQTTFMKGDILVAQSASVLSKLAAGSNNQVLTADSAQSVGIKWGSSDPTTITSMLSTGTYTPPAGIAAVKVEIWGGGGSGKSTNGGGGGGGGYAVATFTSVLLGGAKTVTIGNGGTATTGANVGVTGGNTTFGALLTAYGGAGGGIGTGTTGGGGGGFLGVGGTPAGGIPRDGATPAWGFGGGTGALTTVDGDDSIYGGGGGGGSSGGSTGKGGNTFYGGGGGGGGTSGTATGGVSKFGGNGGAGASSAGVSGSAGSVPGGGGGGNEGSGGGGAGGKGKCVVTEYY